MTRLLKRKILRIGILLLMFIGVVVALWGLFNLGKVAWRVLNLANSKIYTAISTDASVLGGDWLDISSVRNVARQGQVEIPDKLYPRGLNIVFVSDNFESFEEFDLSTNTLISSMREVEPWKSHKEINFFKIFNSDDSICNNSGGGYQIPQLKCDRRIIPIVQQLPLVRTKIVIVSREDFVAWANLTRLENSFVFFSLPESKEGDTFYNKIFLHEFAHGFGLRDETRSIAAQAGSTPTLPEGPNCAPNVVVANELWGDLVRRDGEVLAFNSTVGELGFYFGCAGNESYIRPTQQSLMNIQDFPNAADYGPVSERYLRGVLKYCFSEKRYKEDEDPHFFQLYPEYKECLTQ
jgi:hypothetical protein